MFCSSCGGEYADWVQKCPYCGSVNEAADEKLYMEHLESLRESLDVLDEESEAAYKGDIEGVLRRLFKYLLIALAVILALVAFFTFRAIRKEKAEENQALLQMEWQKEEFPKLDQWYADGKYDQILEEYYELIDQDSDYSIYDWSHSQFICDYYAQYDTLLQAKSAYEKGELSEVLLGEALYDGLSLKYEATDTQLAYLQESYQNMGKGLSSEEVEKVQGYRKEAEAFFRETLSWTSEETEQLYQACKSKDYLSIDPCYKKAEEIMKGEE